MITFKEYMIEQVAERLSEMAATIHVGKLNGDHHNVTFTHDLQNSGSGGKYGRHEVKVHKSDLPALLDRVSALGHGIRVIHHG